jgi:hypothetical protein
MPFHSDTGGTLGGRMEVAGCLLFIAGVLLLRLEIPYIRRQLEKRSIGTIQNLVSVGVA